MLTVLCLATLEIVYMFSVTWLISGCTTHADIWHLGGFVTLPAMQAPELVSIDN